MEQSSFYWLINSRCESLGFPYNLTREITNKIHYINQIDEKVMYDVKLTELPDHGYKVVAEVVDHGKKYKYDIRFTDGKCKMKSECLTMNPGGLSFSDLVGVKQEEVSVERTNRSWNNQSGFILLDGQRRTDVNIHSREYADARYETKRLFDNNGVEMQRVDKILFYPNDERGKYNGSFVFGFAGSNLFSDGFRRPKEVYVNTARREGIDKAIRWQEKFDIMGDRGESLTSYYHLSNEYGLGTMNFNLGTISKEEYDSLPNQLSGDELENALIHDYGQVKERLYELYSKGRTL